jgi:hypothetical protein
MEMSGQLHASAALTPRERGPPCLLDRRLGEPQNRSGHCRESSPGRPARNPSLHRLSYSRLLCVSVSPPQFCVFYAVRVVSNESRQIVLPRTWPTRSRFSVVFLDPRANAELVPKFHVALPASHAALPSYVLPIPEGQAGTAWEPSNPEI